MQSEVTRMKMDAAARVSSSYAQLEQYRIRYDDMRADMEHDIKAFQEAVKDLVFGVKACKVRDGIVMICHPSGH
jgi:hypothetical protein